MEAFVRLRYTNPACTSRPCVWNQTLSKKVNSALVFYIVAYLFFCLYVQVAAALIANINFTKPKRGQEDRQLCIDSSMHETEVAIPTETELNTFFDRLAESSTTVALLSTVPKYSDRFMNIPVPEPNLPPVLSSLYDEKHRNLTESELTAKCQEVFDGLHISNSEALFLEMSTRKQSACLQWFNH